MDCVEAARWLRDATASLETGVAWTYHPLQYAWGVHEAYLRRYGGPKKALLVGMNPGPWGMGQTGVPFGDPVLAGDWLGLRGGTVEAPATTHPKRPVLGWGSKRREMSGQRLWGYFRDRFGTPERALADLLVVNHCPLLLFNEDGQNITPDKLRREPRERMLEVCDEGLRRMVEATGAGTLVGVGRYAEERCRAVAEGTGLRTASIPHPSPASPIANADGGRVWREAVDRSLAALGIAPEATA